MLTNAIVKAARPKSRAYKLADERGLQLHVATSGTRAWRLRFRLAGKEQLLTLGRFPDVDLAAARAAADDARARLDRGEDPREPVADNKIGCGARSFRHAALAWIEHMAPHWSPVHAGDVESSLERDVFAAIGADELAAIARPDVLELLRAIEDRGAIETARRTKQRISAVFEFAMSEGWCDENPADVVGRALKRSPEPVHQPALLELEPARGLFAAIAAETSPPALACQLLALTGVRTATLIGARWEEFEDLDGVAPLWRIPAARMKLSKAKKAIAANDHLVPLCPAATTVLRNLHRLNANSTTDSAELPTAGPLFSLGEGALRAVHDRAGAGDAHVPHGWRATFSTLLNEQLGDDWSEAIDRALAHKTKGKVERAYNRAQQLTRRREIFDAWGGLITAAH